MTAAQVFHSVLDYRIRAFASSPFPSPPGETPEKAFLPRHEALALQKRLLLCAGAGILSTCERTDYPPTQGSPMCRNVKGPCFFMQPGAVKGVTFCIFAKVTLLTRNSIRHKRCRFFRTTSVKSIFPGLSETCQSKFQTVDKVGSLSSRTSDRCHWCGDPHLKALEYQHFRRERIATPVCALARNDMLWGLSTH